MRQTITDWQAETSKIGSNGDLSEQGRQRALDKLNAEVRRKVSERPAQHLATVKQNLAAAEAKRSGSDQLDAGDKAMIAAVWGMLPSRDPLDLVVAHSDAVEQTTSRARWRSKGFRGRFHR